MEIKAAIKTARELIPEFFPGAETASLRLEGAEISEDERYWLVTFSFFEQPTAESPFKEPMFMMPVRAYKTFKLKVADGGFVGFRNGFLDAA